MQRLAVPSLTRAALVSGGIAVALAAATGAVAILEGSLGVANASATYLLAVVAIAVAFGTPAAVATAAGSFLAYDLLFVSPTGALVVADPEEWLNLLLLLVLGMIVGQLAGTQRQRAQAALLRERQARAQYRVSRALATSATAAAALPEIVEILCRETGATRAWVGLGEEGGSGRLAVESGSRGRPAVAATHWLLRRSPGDEPTEWVRVHDPRFATPGVTETQDVAFRVPIVAGGIARGSVWVARERSAGIPGRGDTRVLAAAADQVGQALVRDHLADEATSAEVARRGEAAKTALLDSVSHDLRTPLASIRTAAGSLMDPALDVEPDARRERAAAIDREAEHLNRLVSNLLDMSRIEAGDLRARTEAFPLEDLVDATLARMPALLQGRSVTLAMRLDLPPVEVDAVFLDQVLTNLLENAVKHTPPGTPIRVRAAQLPDGLVRLTVEDGGPGVPPAALGRLFDKFYRVPRPRDGTRRGSGIGLAVVKGLVGAMGGRVSARSGDLGGLAVDVDLPEARPPASADDNGVPDTRAGGAR